MGGDTLTCVQMNRCGWEHTYLHADELRWMGHLGLHKHTGVYANLLACVSWCADVGKNKILMQVYYGLG